VSSDKLEEQALDVLKQILKTGGLKGQVNSIDDIKEDKKRELLLVLNNIYRQNNT